MGLLNFVKKASYGNYWIVTRNWAYIYSRLLQLHKEQFSSADDIVVGASIIDANHYLLNYRLSTDDFYQALEYAKQGQCGTTGSMIRTGNVPAMISHGPASGFHDNWEASFELILNYCVQFVALLLSIDTPAMSPEDVITAVVQGKPKIHDTLDILFRELRYGKGHSLIWNLAIANIMRLDPMQPVSQLMSEVTRNK